MNAPARALHLLGLTRTARSGTRPAGASSATIFSSAAAISPSPTPGAALARNVTCRWRFRRSICDGPSSWTRSTTSSSGTEPSLVEGTVSSAQRLLARRGTAARRARGRRTLAVLLVVRDLDAADQQLRGGGDVATLTPRSAALRRLMSAPISGLPTMSDESTSTAPGIALSFLVIVSAYSASLSRSGPDQRVLHGAPLANAPPPNAGTSSTVMRNVLRLLAR